MSSQALQGCPETPQILLPVSPLELIRPVGCQTGCPLCLEYSSSIFPRGKNLSSPSSLRFNSHKTHFEQPISNSNFTPWTPVTAPVPRPPQLAHSLFPPSGVYFLCHGVPSSRLPPAPLGCMCFISWHVLSTQKCLAPHRHLVNIYWMGERMNEHMRGEAEVLRALRRRANSIWGVRESLSPHTPDGGEEGREWLPTNPAWGRVNAMLPAPPPRDNPTRGRESLGLTMAIPGTTGCLEHLHFSLKTPSETAALWSLDL